MDTALLLHAVMAEAALLVLVLALLVGHACVLKARERQQCPRLTTASSILAAAVEGTEPEPEALKTLAGLDAGGQIAVFAELGQNVVGAQKERLAHVAARIGLVAKGERWCSARGWGRRLRGVRLLTMLGRGDAVVPALLDDPRPEVRAQAAQWVGEHPEPATIERLLAMLSDPETLCRFTVKDSLLRMGRPAVEPLLGYLSRARGAPAVEALGLAAGIADARFLAPALEMCRASGADERARAASLVGSIGGAQATDALTGLLDDPHPDVRASAAGGLGKLSHWPAAGRLADLLSDSSWDVRRTAAVALRAFGAPGVLMLKRALTDEDRFASDMARQVLELSAAGEQLATAAFDRPPARPATYGPEEHHSARARAARPGPRPPTPTAPPRELLAA